MARAAAAALGSETVPEERELSGLEYAGGGLLGQYSPGQLPIGTTTLGIHYFVDGGKQAHRYSILQYPDQPALEAYAWARPEASFSSAQGQRTLTFAPSNSYGSTEEVVVIREVDDLTRVVWTSNGTPPMTADEIAAIELTPAPADDPRWDEIAYESGYYDARG
jgi:hypothetical protein